MRNREKAVISALGIIFLLGAIGYTLSMVQVIRFAWDMVLAEGVLGAMGGIVWAGATSAVSIAGVVLFCVVGTVLTIGPWSDTTTD